MYSCTTPWHWYAHASAAKFRKAAQLSPFIYINAEFPLGAHSVPLKASTGRCKRSSSKAIAAVCQPRASLGVLATLAA